MYYNINKDKERENKRSSQGKIKWHNLKTDGTQSMAKMFSQKNGKVTRGVSKDMNGSEVTCYPYEYSKELDCWVNISGKVTLSSYRAGYKNGTKCMK